MEAADIRSFEFIFFFRVINIYTLSDRLAFFTNFVADQGTCRSTAQGTDRAA